MEKTQQGCRGREIWIFVKNKIAKKNEKCLPGFPRVWYKYLIDLSQGTLTAQTITPPLRALR
jgi:hypothetical protein